MANLPESASASTTLEDRFILALREAGEVYGMWKRLEDLTGIASARWRKAYTAQQRPTPDMVQALCRQRPEYAFWIATGITDAANGHKAPASALPFPEWRGVSDSDAAAVAYFAASLALVDLLATKGGLQGLDEAERREAFGLRNMKRHWWASPLAGVAAEIAKDDAGYKDLKRLRTRRESLRLSASPKLGKKPGRSAVEHPLADPLTQHLRARDLFWD